MPRVRKREAAKRDLIAEWVLIRGNANFETADRFLAAVDRSAEMPSGHPESGAPVFIRKPELRGMRRFPVTDGFDRILIFYLSLQDAEVQFSIHGLDHHRSYNGFRIPGT